MQFSVDPELLKVSPGILVKKQFDNILEKMDNSRSVTPGNAKNYFQFCELVEKAFQSYQQNSKSKATIVWEEPDSTVETNIVSISLITKEPANFGRGDPFSGSVVKQLRPIIRELRSDPDSPDYRTVVLGQSFDILMSFTCWARTNKEAIQLSFDFEEFMEKYKSFFIQSGVQRIFFHKQDADKFINSNGKKYYGRPLIYYVKTEEITTYSEREMEQIILSVGG